MWVIKDLWDFHILLKVPVEGASSAPARTSVIWSALRGWAWFPGCSLLFLNDKIQIMLGMYWGLEFFFFKVAPPVFGFFFDDLEEQRLQFSQTKSFQSNLAMEPREYKMAEHKILLQLGLKVSLKLRPRDISQAGKFYLKQLQLSKLTSAYKANFGIRRILSPEQVCR